MAEITPQGTSQETPQEFPQEIRKPGRPPLLAIFLLLAVLGLVFYVGTNVLTVLYAVIAPPMPPVPANMTQISHTSEAYGVDQWKYVTTGDPCNLVKYLQDNGAVCRIVPLGCGDHRAVDPNAGTQDSLVARCNGKMDFSIFTEQWYSIVSYNMEGKPQLEVNREVFWLGTGPQ